jgi:hypothetical protein
LIAVSASADSRIVKRWPLAGDPHGIAIGGDGTIYVGLAEPQAVVAIDPATGAIRKKVVLDSPDIASTKELVTIRTDGRRLLIANGSDESATILSLPDLSVLREITMEGEPIRDVVPDPKGRYIYLLGRKVHVFDFAGKHELRSLAVEDPTAIATNGGKLAVFDRSGYTLFDTTSFDASPQRDIADVESAVFSGDTLIAATRDTMYEIAGGKVIRDAICLPNGSGPQITTAASANLILFAERTCSSSAFTPADRTATPASLYGVDAYAMAYDAKSNLVYTTERDGYLTIYRVPRVPVVK